MKVRQYNSPVTDFRRRLGQVTKKENNPEKNPHISETLYHIARINLSVAASVIVDFLMTF